MNAGVNLVMIVALLLALAMAGDGGKGPVKANSSKATQMRPSRIAINHNETMVRAMNR